MGLIDAGLRPVFDWLLYPFRDMSPMVGLVLVSIVTAVGLLLIFKYTSNQDALDDVKRRIHACLFEIRLFNDDLRFMFRAQGAALRHTATYMRYSFTPMLWTLPPLVLVIAQLQFHYGYEGFLPGDSTTLHVVLKEPAVPAGKPVIEVEAPGGIDVIDPPVWVPSQREMAWRLEVRELGDFELAIATNGSSVTKAVAASDIVTRRSPIRSAGFVDELLYPAEPPLPSDGPFERITVDYADTTVNLLGWHTHWMIAFFILSMAFAFALRKPFGVTI
jgi:uncharacterized membrane protein (DUF106 family)